MRPVNPDWLWQRNTACYMFADSTGELIAFAKKIKLKSTRIFFEPIVNIFLTEHFRKKAIKNGALSASPDEAGRICWSIAAKEFRRLST